MASSSTISVPGLSPFPGLNRPLGGQTWQWELGSRYLSVSHRKVQLAAVMEEPELLAEQAEDEVGPCILPLYEADQSSAQRCAQVWSPVVSQQL